MCRWPSTQTVPGSVHSITSHEIAARLGYDTTLIRQEVVSANDSVAYGNLIYPDAIRMPPGAELEHGGDAIAQSEQGDYDQATWTIQSKLLDALWINDDRMYGIAEAIIHTLDHADGAEKSFKATKTWLLKKQSSGEWLIKRHM